MTLFFAENLRLARATSVATIIIPRNRKLLSKLAIKYPYIEIIEANAKNFGFLKLLKFVFSANCVIVHPTPGKIPARIKILAKAVSLGHKSVSVGFRDKGILNNLYSILLDYDASVPYIETIKKTIKALGFPVKKESPTLDYMKDENVLRRFRLKAGSYVFIHPLGSNKKRIIPLEDMKWILGRIRLEFGALKIAVSAGPGDKEYINNLQNAFSGDDGIVFLLGLDLNSLANLIDGSELYIGVDTGITHLAAFLRKKSLVVANNATANWLPYYNRKARIVYKIAGDKNNTFEGEEYLRNNLRGRLKPFEFVSKEVIFKYIKEELLKNEK